MTRATLAALVIAALTVGTATATANDRPLEHMEQVEQALHDQVGETWGAAGFGFVVELTVAQAQADITAAYEAEQAAARARALEVARSAPRPVAVSSSVGGSCGGATNGADAFIARESGGNAGVWNTTGSGAWGCYQIMPGTWASSCSDLGTHGAASTSAQAACASRLPLSAWASSGPT